jgi:hypothetical protein
VKKSKVLARVRAERWMQIPASPESLAGWGLVGVGYDQRCRGRKPITVTVTITRGHAKLKGKGR